MNYKLDTSLGNSFPKIAKEAKEIALEKNIIVEFDFNGCTCLVNSTTNLEWLLRDYYNHWIMDWKIIGPDCVAEYSNEVKTELENREKLGEEKRELERIEYQKKEDAEKLIFKEKTKDVLIEFSNKEDWELGKSKNTDGYGACIYEYAEGWAKLMQVEITNGKELKDIAEKTSFEMDFLGITGFMYGAAVQILSQCWKHGEELKNWHNKKYNHKGDGVVNPAILTINN